jgi:hypothetical protein
MAQNAPDERAELRRARQVPAVGRDVHAREHHFPVAVPDEAADLVHRNAHRHRARRPAAIGDDAEGAAVVAAVLDLHEGAGAALEAVHEMQRGLADLHDVVDAHLLGPRQAEIGRPAFRRELLGIAEHAVHLRHGGEALGLDLRRAARDDDPHVRPLAPGLRTRIRRARS